MHLLHISLPAAEATHRDYDRNTAADAKVQITQVWIDTPTFTHQYSRLTAMTPSHEEKIFRSPDNFITKGPLAKDMVSSFVSANPLRLKVGYDARGRSRRRSRPLTYRQVILGSKIKKVDVIRV
ncbi:hypothetical protein ACRALDRAFT_1092066 [Sodiomyces alcalophilus JCM 7366]|uniref:uncharacterized protein n=1 Tax=Sodiomyces alcalophilus JCM 7366 TaxID=591952 RepID=UPI0039B49394